VNQIDEECESLEEAVVGVKLAIYTSVLEETNIVNFLCMKSVWGFSADRTADHPRTIGLCYIQYVNLYLTEDGECR